MGKSWNRLAALGALLALVGWQAAAAPAPLRARDPAAGPIEPGLLWAVSRDGRALGHLFGTFHLPVAGGTTHGHRLSKVTARVEPVLARARTAVFEVDFAAVNHQVMARMMYFQDGRRLDTLLDADTYARARERLTALGVPDAAVPRMKPWAVALALSLPEAREGEPMDRHLQDRARAAGAAIVGLETVAEQLALFDGLPMDGQVAYARQVIDNQERIAETKARMVTAYLAGDLEGILAMTEEAETAEEIRFAAWFRDKVLARRNHRMVERARVLLERGGAFVAVGALHLPGAEGLVNLLRRAGFDLWPVE